MGTADESATQHAQAAELPADLGHRPALEGRRPARYTAEDVVRLRGSVQEEHTLARRGAERLWDLRQHRGLHQRARRDDRQPGRAAGARRPQGDLPVRLAGRGRRQPRRADLPRPEPLPGQLGAGCRPPDQQRADARRPDHAGPKSGSDDIRLVRADRGRRRGRLRRRAQRLRADEGDDPGRRGRRALGGPAVLGQEVRPPRRQGADPDRPAHQDAVSARGWPPTSRACRPGRRPHRRAGRDPDHQRRRRARPSRSSPATARRKASTA